MFELTFLRPAWLLALIPWITLICWKFKKQVQKDAWENVIAPHLLARLRSKEEKKRHQHTFLLVPILLGSIVILALSGISFEKTKVPFFEHVERYTVVLDLSPSMGAEDARPNRLVRATLFLREFLRQSTTIEMSVIIFAAEPYLLTPATRDKKAIEHFLTQLETDTLPKAGSELALALAFTEEMLNQETSSKDRNLLLLTDAETIGAGSFNVAQRFAKKGWALNVLDLGTQTPTRFQDRSGNWRATSTNSTLLAKLAAAGGGTYQKIGNDIAVINTLKKRRQQTFLKQNNTQVIAKESGIYLLWLALPLFLWSLKRTIAPLIILMTLLPIAEPTHALTPPILKTPNQKGEYFFQQKNYTEALNHFTDHAWRASALYREGNYKKAAQLFKDLDEHYNAGNALAKSGQLQEALNAYREVLPDQKTYEDAVYNQKIIEALLDQETQQNGKQNQPLPDESKGSKGSKENKENGESEGKGISPPQQNTQQQKQGEMSNTPEQNNQQKPIQKDKSHAERGGPREDEPPLDEPISNGKLNNSGPEEQVTNKGKETTPENTSETYAPSNTNDQNNPNEKTAKKQEETINSKLSKLANRIEAQQKHNLLKRKFRVERQRRSEQSSPYINLENKPSL